MSSFSFQTRLDALSYDVLPWAFFDEIRLVALSYDVLLWAWPGEDAHSTFFALVSTARRD